ncbi:DUF4185 domain-containing protein [Gordonia sp. LSe1-13]|uniref:DUF4185 domain-containing protein n=2 Tax=Gordonia TaxID=2053 RepID=A0ABU7MK88_9ACTN|nr:DUF4185 domain-containing protein [Gordonia sp. LSe1-13]MEE4024643.1 DUF4185 domain-containing protein [Gordonia sp. PKS22-38]
MRTARLTLVGVVGLSACVLGTTLGAGVAAAAPCGNGGFGSSVPDTGSLGSSGSLGSTGSTGSLGSSGVPNIGPQGPLPPYFGVSTRSVAWVTGPLSPNRTFSRFGISGTDLGVSWDNGRGQTLMAFGDTFGDCNALGQQWRHNVLLRTNDDRLADGIRVPDGVVGDPSSGTVIAPGEPNYAQELIPSVGISAIEVTTIPTAAMSLPRGDGFRQYINYMSVRSWGSAGNWITNFSAIAHSDDNGQTWQTDQNTIRINSPISLALPAALPDVEYNNGKFQQNAYVRGRPDMADQRDYVYQFGTPNGRFGAAFLARFRPADILDLDRYEYWGGEALGWVGLAEMPDVESRVVQQPVTELSVAWSPYLDKYVMLDGDNGIRMRTADRPEGPWSAPRYLVVPNTIVVYGPMMLPNSPALQGDSPELYFNASRWSDYNVMLLRSDLSRVPR